MTRSKLSGSDSAVVGCFLLLVVLPVVTILNGFAVMKMWEWFISPMVNYQMGLVQSIGFAAIVGFLTQSPFNETSKEDTATSVITLSLRPLITLLFGWILHFYM